MATLLVPQCFLSHQAGTKRAVGMPNRFRVWSGVSEVRGDAWDCPWAWGPGCGIRRWLVLGAARAHTLFLFSCVKAFV